MRTRHAALLAVLLAASSGAAALDDRAALRESQAAIGRAIGDYRLRDAGGETVRLGALRGKPLVVSFVYTGCFHVCPTATAALAAAVREAERTFGSAAFNVATIGFNLPFDTPQAMQDFGRRHGIRAPYWRFLSPEADSVQALLADFGFRYEASAAGFDHLLQVSIVDADGRIYRQLYGDSLEARQLTAPLMELARNAPEPAGDIMAMLERVKLLCTIYDPAAGRYRLNYALVIELLVGASVMLFGVVSVALEWRRRRSVHPSSRS